MGMRKITLSFERKEDFFKVYSPKTHDGTIFVAGETTLRAGKPVELKLCFKDIPEGVLFEGFVIWRRLPTKWRMVHSPGIGIRLKESERKRLQFLINYCNGNSLSQRKYGERVQTDLHISCKSQDTHIVGRMRNISKGGLFIETPQLLPTETPVEVAIHVEKGLPPTHLKGQVAWRCTGAVNTGFGVKFRLLSQTARENAKRLVKVLSVPPPPAYL